MGIHDRDYYQDQYRNASSLHRGRKPLSSGRLALFWIAVLAITFAAFQLVPMIGPRAPAVSSSPVSPAPVPAAPSSSTPLAAARPAPVEGSRAAPAGAAPIYRCGNRYGHEPCAGGRAIDGSVASGFDSRPSERLARLVAEGRSADSETVTTTSRTVTTLVNNGSVVAAKRFSECQALAEEIVAIDRDARQPQSARRQDWLRDRRKQARDRQAQLHC